MGSTLASDRLRVSTHPLVQLRLRELRDRATRPDRFRRLVRELALLLGVEALADLPVRETPVQTPLEQTTGAIPALRLALVPVLRAGLGMSEGLLELLPDARVLHFGAARDEATLRPRVYYALPDPGSIERALVLDPMLATGGSACAALDALQAAGVRDTRLLCLIAAPEGVRAVARAHPETRIHLAALDRGLDEQGFIRPGLGDAGDRQFGT